MSDQTAPAAPNPGIAIQYAIHGAVRRDMSRLVEVLGRPGAAPAAVTDYAVEFLDHLHHHHTFEDAEVWPVMGQRLGPAVSALLERNAAVHGRIEAAVAAFAGEIERLDDDPTAAHAAAVRMSEVVSEHLDHEEAEVIPLVADVFTLDDFARFQALSAEQDPPPRFLPWLLDDAPEPVAAAFTAALPPPVQEQLSTTWMPVWQAKVDALLAARGVTSPRS
jgi:hemerythrin-like domain-containing protein